MDIFSKHIANIRHSNSCAQSPCAKIQNSNRILCTGQCITRKQPIRPNEFATIRSLEIPFAQKLKKLVSLETDRLIIRKLSTKDAIDIFEYSKDEDVAKHVLWHAHKSPKESYEYMRFLEQKYKYGEPASLGIEYKESCRIIGTIGFNNIDYEHNIATVGYSLKKGMWNKGIISEALSAILYYGFEYLGINRIEALCETENIASARVLEKCGMKYEGTIRSRFYNKERFVDAKEYSILFDEYKDMVNNV